MIRLFDSSGILKFRKGLCECEYSEIENNNEHQQSFLHVFKYFVCYRFLYKQCLYFRYKVNKNIDNAKIKG